MLGEDSQWDDHRIFIYNSPPYLCTHLLITTPQEHSLSNTSSHDVRVSPLRLNTQNFCRSAVPTAGSSAGNSHKFLPPSPPTVEINDSGVGGMVQFICFGDRQVSYLDFFRGGELFPIFHSSAHYNTVFLGA